MSARIDCGLDNGETGDKRVALALREARDLGGAGEGLEPAIETNGGPIMIRCWERGTDEDSRCGAATLAYSCSLSEAADELDCSEQAIRDALVTAYPDANGWDWA